MQVHAIALLAIGIFGVLPLEADQAEVERYSEDIQAALHGSTRISLVGVLEAGLAAAKALEGSGLEQLDEPAFERVRTAMTGFVVWREELVYVRPRTSFFLRLAREKGTAADGDFFSVLHRTYPDDVWPVYYLPQTDITGCTVFDGRTLPDSYGAWLAFQTRHPNSYKAEVRKELRAVETAMESTCSCGTRDEVRRDFEGFLKTFPRSPAAPRVTSRLAALRAGSSKIRFSCGAH